MSAGFTAQLFDHRNFLSPPIPFRHASASSSITPPQSNHPTMPPKVKLPTHLPKTWKYGNRNLKPALSQSSREAYKERIITPKIEPLWSRGIHFFTYVACAGAHPTTQPADTRGIAVHCLLLGLWSPWTCVVRGKLPFCWVELMGIQFRDWTDSMWAQYWYISSKDRKRVEEARAKQDEKIREQERLLDERIAKRRAQTGRLQTS